MMDLGLQERLTRVGPGTPGGNLLRRYWHPLAVAGELTPDAPTRFVRILGEDLVLFRDLSGRVGLLADHCSHRGASLCYGRVEERGIACPYHGWLYDTAGTILETPPERNQAVMKSVRQTAYPVRRLLGLYWAYLGPLPAPEITPYDVWMRRDGAHRIIMHPRLDCNWLQAMENSVDPSHLHILHQELIGRGRKPLNSTRGFIDDVESTDFEAFAFGIWKKRRYKDGRDENHPLLFPNMLREGNATQIRVPEDDTHTVHIHIQFYPGEPGPNADNPPVEHVPAYKSPPDALHPRARFRMDQVIAQDHMAWETQGPIANRQNEHLSHSDRGVVLLRRMLAEQVDRVERGEDPIGVVRDPQHPIIDTNLDATVQEMIRSGRLALRRVSPIGSSGGEGSK